MQTYVHTFKQKLFNLSGNSINYQITKLTLYYILV